jgi:protein-histidine pros-kinase
MKLLLKFNLVFLVVFIAGLAVSATIARNLLQRDAKAEVVDRARLLMEKAVVVSAYTTTQIAPLLETQMKYSFLPQSIPAYSSMEILTMLRAKYPEYGYKPAMLNPTNPRDRALEWEADIINQFKQSPDQAEAIGVRDTPNGPSLFIARPIKISNPACLRCHSTVAAAPQTLIDKYGPNNGFGWNMTEPRGAHVVSVPMAVPLAQADRMLTLFMAILVGIFLVIIVILNVLLHYVVIKPVVRISRIPSAVSLGEMDAEEYVKRGKDEIASLTHSFGRMRRSLEGAMKMLEG